MEASNLTAVQFAGSTHHGHPHPVSGTHVGVDVLGRNVELYVSAVPAPGVISLHHNVYVTSVACTKDGQLHIGLEDVGAALAAWNDATLLVVDAGWGCFTPNVSSSTNSSNLEPDGRTGLLSQQPARAQSAVRASV